MGLGSPKLRQGSYFPPFMEPHKTVENAGDAAVIQEVCFSTGAGPHQ